MKGLTGEPLTEAEVERLRLPWHRETIGHRDHHEIAAQVARDLAFPLAEGLGPNTGATWIVNADNKIVAFVGNGPRQTDNADAIIAAVESVARSIPETQGLRPALARLVKAVEAYSPRDDHDWRCEYRTAEAGYVEGGPPVIRCECGFDDLGLAVRDALDALAAPSPDPEAWKAALAAADERDPGWRNRIVPAPSAAPVDGRILLAKTIEEIESEAGEQAVDRGLDVAFVVAQHKIDLETCVEIADRNVVQDIDGEPHAWLAIRRVDWDRIVAVARGHKSQAAQRAIDKYHAAVRDGEQRRVYVFAEEHETTDAALSMSADRKEPTPGASMTAPMTDTSETQHSPEEPVAESGEEQG
ncbi:MAG TPA: hypothetical protein VFI40_04840 [Nocardioides sp.]|nr:hypothetical protein [Nocardioides sp.]